MKKVLQELTEKHIKGTLPKAIVTDKVVVLCRLTNAVSSFLKFDDSVIYINTRVLKHLYDKKPAEEFVFLICNLHTIAKYPNSIYQNKEGKNKEGKRGEICFVKKIKGAHYMCSLENKKGVFIVTAFRIRDKKYLNKYTLLWSWESDKSPS